MKCRSGTPALAAALHRCLDGVAHGRNMREKRKTEAALTLDVVPAGLLFCRHIMHAGEDGGLATAQVVKSEPKTRGAAAATETAAAADGMAAGGVGLAICAAPSRAAGAEGGAAAADFPSGRAGNGDRRGAITAVDAIRIYLAKSDKNPRTSLR